MTTPYGVNSFNFAHWEIVCPSISFPQPGENPDPGVWKPVPLVLLFSEICDPRQGEGFIELYSPNKSNYRIVEDLIIKRWVGDSINPNDFEKLTGLTINEDGFLILCVDQSKTAKCSKSIGWNSIITPGAASTYCIAKCAHLYVEECPCVDWYGKIGLPTIDSDYDYSGGRAYRVTPYANTQYFDESHWRFANKISQYDECDPGELTPPSPTPNTQPNPTPNQPSGPSKPNWRPSKGGPSKGRRQVLRK